MIITIICILLLIAAFIFAKTDFDFLFVTSLTIGVFGTLLCVAFIISNHVCATKDFEKNQIRYEGLVKRLELINSEYEDVSKSDVIRDISEWNAECFEYHYWTNNLLTNWFHSKKVAESYIYIDLGE